MHTTRLSETTIALHNSDYSGEIILRQKESREGGSEPAMLLITADEAVALVASMVRSKRIEEAEQASDRKLLGLE